MSKTWFITGAGRGLGLVIAKAVMRAGDRVVATGRKRDAVVEALGADSEQCLSLEMNVTHEGQVHSAVEQAAAKFGGIDVLVNNAGYGHLGYFEENTMRDVEEQFKANVFGVFNVTWAVLPVMRRARKGVIFNMSSVAGIRGNEFGALYSASKFALEGFSESLAKEVEPFGIAVTIVEPGPFRTDFLTRDSLRFGSRTVPDYDDRREKLKQSFEGRSGKQPGDPQKLADALLRLADETKPPLRFLAGAFAVKTAEEKFEFMRHELQKWREQSIKTDF